MMPDLLNFWLTGQKVSEFTIATTSQALDPYRRAWATGLLERLGIPTHYLPPIVEPGTVLGGLLPAVIDETGAKGVQVIAPGSHDTAQRGRGGARRERRLRLSQLRHLVADGGRDAASRSINETALAFNFTNEGGVCDTIRLLKNIIGLWIIQECRRTWAAEGAVALLGRDRAARRGRAALRRADRRGRARLPGARRHAGAHPGVLSAHRSDRARRRRHDRPRRLREPGAEVSPGAGNAGDAGRPPNRRAAHRRRRHAEPAAQPVRRRMRIGRPVVAGPIEATAVGNLLMQMLATGAIGSLAEGRALVRRSFDTETYGPQDAVAWDEAHGRFRRLIGD